MKRKATSLFYFLIVQTNTPITSKLSSASILTGWPQFNITSHLKVKIKIFDDKLIAIQDLQDNDKKLKCDLSKYNDLNVKT